VQSGIRLAVDLFKSDCFVFGSGSNIGAGRYRNNFTGRAGTGQAYGLKIRVKFYSYSGMIQFERVQVPGHFCYGQVIRIPITPFIGALGLIVGKNDLFFLKLAAFYTCTEQYGAKNSIYYFIAHNYV
jgi:hypothetical protein